jgi:hypothetical protein
MLLLLFQRMNATTPKVFQLLLPAEVEQESSEEHPAVQ